MNDFRTPMMERRIEGSPDTETASGASQILTALLKALKAYRLYLPSHPLLREFVDDLSGRVDTFLSRYGELCLTVQQFQILIDETPIYESRVKEESLAFRLFIHGIREITFHAGLDRDQVASFLQVLHRSFDTQSAADDLLANLWERDLPHVNFIILDDLFDESESEEFDDYIAEQRRRRGATAPRPGLPFVAHSLPPVDPGSFSAEARESLSDLLRLEPAEQEGLKADILAEAKRNAVDDIDGVLLDVLAVCRGEDEETARNLLQTAIETLLEEGRLEPAVRLHGEFKRHYEVPGESRSESIPGLNSQRVLQALKPYLTQTPLRDADTLADFLSDLGPTMVSGLTGCLEEPGTREGALEVLRRTAPGQLTALIAQLRARDGIVLKLLLRILGDSRNPYALTAIAEQLRHKDLGVRREAVLAIQKIGTPTAFPFLQQVLEGSDPELRIMAARALSSIPPGPHLEPLLPIAQAKSFAKRSFIEKSQILLALGRQTDPDSEEFLISLLKAKRWFRRGSGRDLRAAAVTALGERGSPAAVDAIEGVLGDPSPEIHRVVLLALKAARESAARGGPPETTEATEGDTVSE